MNASYKNIFIKTNLPINGSLLLWVFLDKTTERASCPFFFYGAHLPCWVSLLSLYVDFSVCQGKAREEDCYSPAYVLPLLFKHGNGKTFLRKEKSTAPYGVTEEQ